MKVNADIFIKQDNENVLIRIVCASKSEAKAMVDELVQDAKRGNLLLKSENIHYKGKVR